MNGTRIIQFGLLFGLSVAITGAQQPENPQRPVFRDAATHDALANRLREAQANNPLANFRTSENPTDPSVANRPVDIIENSDIISFNGLTTLVPKRAILVIPASVQNRVGKHVHGHRIVPWSEFLVANRGWITQVEVSRAQAEGNQPLSEQMTERIRKSSNLMVATYQGGPISVLPPKEPEAAEEEAAE